MSKRHDFTAKTKEILAKRVGYICSNPKCKKHTIGPNEEPEKATNIGVAAHITAASPGGPRFDEELSQPERSHIKNGIWLCSSCSTLIDRDEEKFTIEILNEWKNKSEEEISSALEGKKVDGDEPFIEADLIWNFHGRVPNGYSRKNLEVFEQPIQAGTDLYQHWSLRWNFRFTLHNNSEVPAFNISLNPISDQQFNYIEELPKINNIPPYQSTEVEAKFIKYFHGTSAEADRELQPVPNDLNELIIDINYKDKKREDHHTYFKIVDGSFQTIKSYSNE